MSVSSEIARPPAPQLAGYPVAQVIAPATEFTSAPYTPGSLHAIPWRSAQDVQAGMNDGQQLVVCCPECGQLLPWQSEHLLVCCGYCGSTSSLPIVAA